MRCLDGGHAGQVSRQPEKGHLAEAERLMIHAANSQSQVEGRNGEELAEVRAIKRAEWKAMGNSMAFKAEFRDWIAYCKSLARSYNVKSHKSMLR